MKSTSISAPLTALLLIAAVCMVIPTAAFAGDDTAHQPTSREQCISLEEMCEANADAIAARQAEKSLYERLGGREGIRKSVAEVVRLHGENPSIKHMVEGIDTEHLIEAVTDFLVVGTGGEGEYTGKDMVAAHAKLKLTNADFLSAGGDVMKAMKATGQGEEEIQEVICAFVALRSQVVIGSERDLGRDKHDSK